jgi:hypothetical protein
MGRGLSALQKRILIAVYQLESPLVPGKLRAHVRDVAKHIYGDKAKIGTNRAAFARSVIRLDERGLVQRWLPGISENGNPNVKWLSLTDKARNTHRLMSSQDAAVLTDSEANEKTPPTCGLFAGMAFLPPFATLLECLMNCRQVKQHRSTASPKARYPAPSVPRMDSSWRDP